MYGGGYMNVRWEVCSRLPPVLSKSLNTPVMKVPNTSYFNIINLSIINIILIIVLHCMTQLMLLLTQCREFSKKLTLITMKLKLNLFKKLTNEDKHVITIIADLIGCALLVIALCYGVYWCLISWLLS
jgi:hypothetical protein